jgi:two-component system sensor histidine kinase HydH
VSLLAPFDATAPRLSPASLLVVGAAPGLEDVLAHDVIPFRTETDDGGSTPHPLLAIVLDTRSVELELLAQVRRRRAPEGVPVMAIISDYADAEAIALRLDVDDVIRTAAPIGELRRRITMLVALGRARAATAFAGRALAQSAASLVDRQKFAHAILDGVDVGIITTDPSGAVTFVNRTAATAVGSFEQNVGRDVRDVLRLDYSPASLVGGGSRVVFEHAFPGEGGTDLDLELTISRPQGPTHDAVGFFCIFRDIGLDKQREEERRRFERLAAMGTMVAGFAHEVRNPLAALRSLVESLAEDLAADLGLRMPQVGRMIDVLERVERLVRTSLQFGRPDPPRRAQHRPWTVVSQALSAIGPRARELGGHVRLEVDPDLPDLVVDEGQLVQVLVILLDNALDATGISARVLLRAGIARADSGNTARKSSPPPGSPDIELEVVDDGPGVPPEILHRIFDPFFTTKPSGTGLGLSIAQQLVSENGGHLEVTSSRGETSFTVRLPSAERMPSSLRPPPIPPLPRGSIA